MGGFALKSDQHKLHVRSFVITAVVLLLFAAGCYIAMRSEDSQYQERRSVASEGFGQLPSIEYNGARYRKKAGVHTLLLIGYDKESDAERIGYRDGGQSDFLVLLVINDTDNTVRQLHIDRDTMTRVKTLGLAGQEAGGRVMQICLAHAYGKTIEINDRRTAEAVEGFLPGVTVDNTISMGLDIISNFNHLIGGVTVTLEEDFTNFDPEMKAGVTLHLNDQQAYYYCRSRMLTGDGLNTSRMRRQRTYIEEASKQMLVRIQADGSFAATMVNSVEKITHCTLSKAQVINEINRAATFDIGHVEMLPSEHAYGRGGYMECYVKEEDVMAGILDAVYEKV